MSEVYHLLKGGSCIESVSILTVSELGNPSGGVDGGHSVANVLIPNFRWRDYDINHGLDTLVYSPYKESINGSMKNHVCKPGLFDRLSVLYAIPDFPQSQLDTLFREYELRSRSFIESNWQINSSNGIDLKDVDRESLERIPEYHIGLDKTSSGFVIDKTVGRETSWIKHGDLFGFDSQNCVLDPTSDQYPFTYTTSHGTQDCILPEPLPFESPNASFTSCVLFPITARFSINEKRPWDTQSYWFDGLIDWSKFKLDEHWMTYQRYRPFPMDCLNSVSDNPEFNLNYWDQHNLMSSIPFKEYSNPVTIRSKHDNYLETTLTDTLESNKRVASLQLGDLLSFPTSPALENLTGEHQLTIVNYSQEIIYEVEYEKRIKKVRSLVFLLNAEKTKNFGKNKVTFLVKGCPEGCKVGVIKGGVSFKSPSKGQFLISAEYSTEELLAFYLEGVGNFDKISVEGVESSSFPVHACIFNALSGRDMLPLIGSSDKNTILLGK